MKTQFKNTSLALAVSALLASPLAFAVSVDDDVKFSAEVSIDVSTSNNQTNVILDKQVSVTKDVDFVGTVDIFGLVLVDTASMALIDDKQINFYNFVNNFIGNNNASANVFSNSGNTGVNSAAGDNNQQANAGAIAVTDQGFVFGQGSADAEIFARQRAEHNVTFNFLHTNTANGDVQGNFGNTGVNVAAGDSNQQKNDLAISVATNAAMAEASVAVKQQNDHNFTDNFISSNTAFANVVGNVGNTGVNVAAGTNNQQYNGLAIAVTQ